MKRRLAWLLAALVLASMAAGCKDQSNPDPSALSPSSGVSASEALPEAVPSEASGESAPADTAEGGMEAPALAEQVAAGTLPPLEERLPAAADIMVEPDVLSIGQYGGDFTVTTLDNGRWSWGFFGEQSMFRFKQDGSGEVEANVCKEYSANEDATVWTIRLREGMKWSDGAPFTAEDILFYYDHMSTPALNEDRTEMDAEAPGYYSTYTSKPYNCYQVKKDGQSYWAAFEKVDDYTFTVSFAAPKPGFAEEVAVDNKWMFLPKHFYKQYVARKDGVTTEEDFPLITEEEALAAANRDFGKQWDSYGTMSKDIGYYHWDYAIVPQVRSFIAEKDNWDTVGETYRMVRNPYFWKTDSEGHQLPYLDSIQVKIINEQDQITMQAMAGAFDMYEPSTDFSTVATALKDTHTLKPWISPAWSTDETLQLNQTVKDPDKRALFQDPRFRQALSIAVDRNLLNETIRNGVSRPMQAAVAEGLPAYDAEWANKWTEYDVDEANKLMDELTEPWDKKDGSYRRMKGTQKEAEIILSVREPSESADFTSLLQAAYKAIGVKLSVKVDADYRTTMLSNDVEASVEVTSVSTPAIRGDSIVPIRNVAVWHSAYGKWYEDGGTEDNGGIAPTGDVLALIEAYEAIQSAEGPDREAIIQENEQKIYDLHKENVWIIGYLEAIPSRLLVHNSIENFPEGLMNVDEFRFQGLARPEQFWRSDLTQ